jgi:hypothetical protein
VTGEAKKLPLTTCLRGGLRSPAIVANCCAQLRSAALTTTHSC